MNNFFLLLKNINNYGLNIFFKMVFFEIYYSIKFLNIKSLKYEQVKQDNYFKTKENKNYNTPYIPTPYFFLNEIDKFFEQKKIKNYLFVDLGCGYSRTRLFFAKNTYRFLGFDYNSKIISYLKRKNIKKSFFFNKNLRSQKSIKFLINKVYKLKKNRKIIIFFSDSFELNLLNKIIFQLKKKITFYCVIVNLKNKNFLNKRNNYIYKKNFMNKNRNIFIFKIP